MHKPFSKPPECVFVDGKNYSINTDFRIWAELCSFMESSAPYEEKILRLLINGYTNELPPHMDSAVSALFEFMAQGNKSEKGFGSTSEKLMDFSQDEGLIYSSFLAQYGIDLYSAKLHWWSFMHLLNSLDENSAFMKIVGYRSVNCQSIKNKEMRKFYRKMKNKYTLSGNMKDEKIATALESIM